MQLDKYIRCISLQKNKLTDFGIKLLAREMQYHGKLLSLDLRDNKGKDEKALELLKLVFLRNLRECIAEFSKD